jgi:hypothetical protein
MNMAQDFICSPPAEMQVIAGILLLGELVTLELKGLHGLPSSAPGKRSTITGSWATVKLELLCSVRDLVLCPDQGPCKSFHH